MNTISNPDRPISQLAVTWLLMIPLVYFASQGLLWFQSVASNNSLSAGYGSLATGSMSKGNIAVAVSVFTVVSMVLLPRLLPILSLCRDAKSFVLMCVLAIASCFWSQFPLKSFEWSLCLVGNTLFAFYLFQRFSFERLLKLLIVMGWICLVFSIALSLFFPRYGLDQAGGSVGAWRGMYPHKNSCSMMTVFLLSPVFFVATNTFVAKCFRALYVGLSTVVVILSEGRTGWILLACLLVYVYSVNLLRRITRDTRRIILLLGAIAALLLIVVGVTYSGELSYLLGKDPTLTGRTDIWKSVGTAIMKHPVLGYGYCAFWRGYQGESANSALVNGWAVTSAHNGFLQVWLTLGAVGSGLVLYSLVTSFRNAVTCFLAEAKPYHRWYGCVIVLFLVINIDEAEMMSPNRLVWMLYIIACLGLSNSANRIRSGLAHG